MGGVVKSVFGGSDSKSKQSSRSEPKDLTPGEFKDLRDPVSEALQQQIASGGGAQFGGGFTAPVTGNEQQLLNLIQQGATQGATGTQGATNQFLQQLISGQAGTNVAGGPLTDVSSIQGGTVQGETNPFLQQAIAAAQRPLIDQFRDEIAPALRAQFTMAGQEIAGQGSSPFQMAAARAQSGLANALGDISGRLAFEDFAQRQQLGSQEFQQLRDLTVGQELAQQELQTQEAQANLNRRLEAVSQAQGVERSQLENLLASLEAQALPRLVEQFGIDQGLEEFRRRQNQLLDVLSTAGALGSPTVGQVSTSSGRSSSSSSEGIGGALGGAIGSIFSSREFKQDITPADEAALVEAIESVDLFNYRYRPGMGIDGQWVGGIAEDVPEPFAGEGRRTINLVNMVSALIAANREKATRLEALEKRMAALEANNGQSVS